MRARTSWARPIARAPTKLGSTCEVHGNGRPSRPAQDLNTTSLGNSALTSISTSSREKKKLPLSRSSRPTHGPTCNLVSATKITRHFNSLNRSRRRNFKSKCHCLESPPVYYCIEKCETRNKRKHTVRHNTVQTTKGSGRGECLIYNSGKHSCSGFLVDIRTM